MALHEPFGTRRESQRRKPLVLIVDDEYGPRESIAFSLSAEFDTRTAGRATDALRLLVEQRFDLVLLDIRMPEMDGIELARRATELDPDIKVMFITGFAAVALNPDNNAPKDAKVLSKPFHLKDLVSEVQRLLAA